MQLDRKTGLEAVVIMKICSIYTLPVALTSREQHSSDRPAILLL